MIVIQLIQFNILQYRSLYRSIHPSQEANIQSMAGEPTSQGLIYKNSHERMVRYQKWLGKIVRERHLMMKSDKVHSKTFKQSHIKIKKQHKLILGSGKTKDKLKIACWNVNGLRNIMNKNLIRDFIFKFKPDILCISQTKIDEQLYSKNKFQIDQYNSYWNFCKKVANHSGIVVYTKFLPLAITEDIETPEFQQSSRILTLQFEKFYLVSVLAPFAGKKLEYLNFKLQFDRHLYNYCNKIREKGKGVIICGDFNTAISFKDTHLAGYTNRSAGFTEVQRKKMKAFLQKGWVDVFRKLNPEVKKYSWWNIQHSGRENRIGKRLDYFLLNQQFSEVGVASDINFIQRGKYKIIT